MPTPLDSLSFSQLKSLSKTLKLNMNPSTRKQTMKQRISNELARRLCRCEQAILRNDPKKNVGRAIGICQNSIIRNRGLSIQGFRCRGKPSLLKTRKQKVVKPLRK